MTNRPLGYPYHFVKRALPKPSMVYDTYWRFAAERQEIFMKKLHGELAPWTKDPILDKYKFTNVYRASDRTSQYLIKEVIYGGSQNPTDLFFRILVFKTFNRISTWQYLERTLGSISWEGYSFEAYDSALRHLLANKCPIYSAAYIMASGKSFFGQQRKHQNHLKLIEKMIYEQVPQRLQGCKSMADAYQLLLDYPTIGEFLAYQYVTDINYSTLTNFSEREFVQAGPGAKDGVSKCFLDFGDYSYEDLIRLMCDKQHEEFERLGINFKGLGDRDMQLIDCQNVFCEVDKYARLAHPNVPGKSNRSRIKQKYSPTSRTKIDLFFPPKWNLNPLIS